MEAFYALAVEDYRQMVAARDWAGDLPPTRAPTRSAC